MSILLRLNHFGGHTRYQSLHPAGRALRLDKPHARIFPAKFPYGLKRRPDLRGEHLVYQAIVASLPESWTAYYNSLPAGSRRKIDFCILAPGRGLIAIEVKGGLVHAGRGHLRQSTRTKASKLGKRIEPFRQVKRALADLWEATGIAPGLIPTFIMAAFPHMSEKAFPWAQAPHVLTREDLETDKLRERLDGALPAADRPLPKLDALMRGIASDTTPRKATRAAKSRASSS